MAMGTMTTPKLLPTKPIRSIPANGRNLTDHLVLFDLDDTLCDYSGARYVRLCGAFGRAFEAVGISPGILDQIVTESIAIHPHGSDHFAMLLTQHGVLDPELHRDARRWYHHHRFLGLQLFPDAIEIVRTIRAMTGVSHVGLITNGPADVQFDKLALLDLNREVDFSVISGVFGTEKPHPEIFAEAMRLGSAIPGRTIYIGDSPQFDVEGARASGIVPVWINRTPHPWPLATPKPKYEIDDLTALLPVVSTWVAG
jgi:HAD superfamily hydrolase (TIGR01549 family)